MTIVAVRARALRALALAGVVGLSLLASACGDSSGAKVAQVGTAQTTTTGAISSRNGKLEVGVRYAACMRQHGVPEFADPDTSGTFRTLIPRNSPKFKAAERTCQHLLAQRRLAESAGTGDVPAGRACLRQVHARARRTEFPRSAQGPDGGPEFPEIGPSTPQFKAAQRACHELLPGSPTGAP